MSIFARLRQVYARLRERTAASADGIGHDRGRLSDRVNRLRERDRRIAVERDSKLLGLITGSQ